MQLVEKIRWHLYKGQTRAERGLIKKLSKYFKGKSGIEVGGPTELFNTELPIYKLVKEVDGCNFSEHTVWEGDIEAGNTYTYYPGKTGRQYICEASDLKEIANASYDFVLASHCLEHCANALITVQEWLRVLKPGGHLLLVLPDRRYTFDHKREVTSFNHLLSDLQININETDLSHLEEIIALHDLSMDEPAGDVSKFRQRSLLNFQNRCLHHHVFDFNLLNTISDYFGTTVKFKEWLAPFHQIMILQKPGPH